MFLKDDMMKVALIECKKYKLPDVFNQIFKILNQDTNHDFKCRMLKDFLAPSKSGKNSETDTSSNSTNPSFGNPCTPKLDKSKK